MPIILAIIALAVPRLVMFFIWLLTNGFGLAYRSTIWPVLGFVFMPYTTLAYMAAMLNNAQHVDGFWLVLVVAAVVVDLGHLGGGWRYRRR